MQFENRPPELQIFSIEGSIENLMKEYEMAVRNKQFERAQEIVEEINNLDKQKIEIQQGTKTNQIQNIKSILNAGTLGMTPGKDMGGRPIRMEADTVKKSQEDRDWEKIDFIFCI
jgi:shikimate 5-dehydrogenase